MEEQPREEEVVDGLPVLAADVRVIEPVQTGVVPARQAAAIAATTFVAGAATVAMVNRRRAKPSRKRKKSKSAIGEIVGSNSFLVDVHLLRRD
jgi:phosphoribosylpyrophosphate synthetase